MDFLFSCHNYISPNVSNSHSIKCLQTNLLKYLRLGIFNEILSKWSIPLSRFIIIKITFENLYLIDFILKIKRHSHFIFCLCLHFVFNNSG